MRSSWRPDCCDGSWEPIVSVRIALDMGQTGSRVRLLGIHPPVELRAPGHPAGGSVETTLRQEAVGRVLGKGYSPVDYTLLCYGGGGPLHVCGYTSGVPYREVLVPAWAAVEATQKMDRDSSRTRIARGTSQTYPIG